MTLPGFYAIGRWDCSLQAPTRKFLRLTACPSGRERCKTRGDAHAMPTRWRVQQGASAFSIKTQLKHAIFKKTCHLLIKIVSLVKNKGATRIANQAKQKANPLGWPLVAFRSFGWQELPRHVGLNSLGFRLDHSGGLLAGQVGSDPRDVTEICIA